MEGDIGDGKVAYDRTERDARDGVMERDARDGVVERDARGARRALHVRVMSIAVLIACVCTCGRDERVPASIDGWARRILAMPVDEVCTSETYAGYFCQVKPSLLTPEVRAIGATYITLQPVTSSERHLNFDFGGGHVEAHGVLIGPAGWVRVANSELGERKLRDGVFAYDTRQ